MPHDLHHRMSLLQELSQAQLPFATEDAKTVDMVRSYLAAGLVTGTAVGGNGIKPSATVAALTREGHKALIDLASRRKVKAGSSFR